MRDQADHEVTAMMKAQFMSLWDGKCDYIKESIQLSEIHVPSFRV